MTFGVLRSTRRAECVSDNYVSPAALADASAVLASHDPDLARVCEQRLSTRDWRAAIKQVMGEQDGIGVDRDRRLRGRDLPAWQIARLGDDQEDV